MSVLDFVDQIHHYSVDEYERLVALDAFEDQRVELIDGLVLDMSPRSPRHENAVRWLHNRWLVSALDHSQHDIQVCGSLRLARSEPEPDLAIVDPHFGTTHPTTASLVVEVSLSSRDRDLTLKPRLYAATVLEYWVIDLSKDRAVVHREPEDIGYRDVSIHGRDAELRPLHAAVGPLRLSDLFDAI